MDLCANLGIVVVVSYPLDTFEIGLDQIERFK
jgi:hypothetical protein